MTDDSSTIPASTVLDVISRIRELNGVFSRREQRVADYILANYEAVQHQSQNEIAQAASVSDATVTRFCQSIGCTGFRDFRIRFAQSLAVSLQYLSPSKMDSDSVNGDSELIDYVFRSVVNLLTLARNQIDTDSISLAVEVIAAAERIVFFGVGGNSSNVAAEGVNRFFRLGIPSECHSDGYFQRMIASTLDEGDVVIVISSSGVPAELLDSVAIASQYKAKTISITKKESPLSMATDIAIELVLPEEKDIYKPTASRVVYLTILDILATGVARARPDIAKENLRRIRTSMVQVNRVMIPSPIGD